MNFNLNKVNNEKEIYCVCNSELIGEIKLCKSYNGRDIDIECDILKNIGIGDWNLKTEIKIEPDYIGESINDIIENVEIFKKTLEKLFEIKENILNELVNKTLDLVVNYWWESDIDDAGNVIDAEYIKKCLTFINIFLTSDSNNISMKLDTCIDGLNEEDFLLGHMLEALIYENEDYKVEFDIA